MSAGTTIYDPCFPGHRVPGNSAIDNLWKNWHDNISAVLRLGKDPIEFSKRIKMNLERYSNLFNLEVSKPPLNPQLSRGLLTTSTALLQVLKFAVIFHCSRYHCTGVERVLELFEQRELETKIMMPHDDKGLGGDRLLDDAGLLALSIAQAVELNDRGDQYFGLERYHEALHCYVSATIKLMPWDTALLSLETSNTSGFLDAEFAIMSNIMEAGARVMGQLPDPGFGLVVFEAKFLRHMLKAASEYMTLSPAYRSGANKDHDDLLRTVEPGPLAGRIGSVVLAKVGVPVSVQDRLGGILFFREGPPKEDKSILYRPRTPNRIRAAQKFGAVSRDMLPGMVPLGTMLGWIRFLSEGGVRGEAVAEEEVV